MALPISLHSSVEKGEKKDRKYSSSFKSDAGDDSHDFGRVIRTVNSAFLDFIFMTFGCRSSVEAGRGRPLRHRHLDPGRERVGCHDRQDGLQARSVHHLGYFLKGALYMISTEL